MLSIGDARLAIFNGDPKIALKLMESAKADLAPADKDAPTTPGGTSSTNANPNAANTESNMRYVPVDGQFALADDFVMTPEKKAHIDKADESFKKGDHA